MKRQLAHVACVDDDPDILLIVEIGLETAGNLEVTLVQGPARAPQKLIEAMACLLDDEIAEKAYQVIYQCARKLK